MASGYFPLNEYDNGSGELTAMAERLREISADYCYESAINCTPEDAASDGGYQTRLHLAAEFIEYCIKQPN
jgi:hypothetical protein